MDSTLFFDNNLRLLMLQIEIPSQHGVEKFAAEFREALASSITGVLFFYYMLPQSRAVGKDGSSTHPQFEPLFLVDCL